MKEIQQQNTITVVIANLRHQWKKRNTVLIHICWHTL